MKEQDKSEINTIIDYSLLSIILLRKYDLEINQLYIEEMNSFIAEYGFEYMNTSLNKQYGEK